MTIHSSVPESAEEKVLRTDEHGYRYCECILDGKAIATRHRHPDGSLEEEKLVQDGLPHGYLRQFEPDGTLRFETYYDRGHEHGTAKQYANDGRLLGTYTMDHGTGTDIWRDEDGSLSEYRTFVNSRPEGVEQWWDEGNQSVYIEMHWRNGKLHGIERWWEVAGKQYAELSSGYPKFHLAGKKVSAEEYGAAAATDASLRPYDPTDDNWTRQLPEGI